MIAQVRVIGIELGVGMCDDLGIVGGPDRSGDRRAEKREKPAGRQGERHPGREAEPPGKRIGQEPAGMRQRELRREDRRPVGGLRRAPQKPAGRSHDGGVADPEQGPGDYCLRRALAFVPHSGPWAALVVCPLRRSDSPNLFRLQHGPVLDSENQNTRPSGACPPEARPHLLRLAKVLAPQGRPRHPRLLARVPIEARLQIRDADESGKPAMLG